MHIQFSNPFATISIQAPCAKDRFLKWEDGHFDQGFIVAVGEVAVSTTCDENFELEVLESNELDLPVDCIFAIQLPFENNGSVTHIRGGYSDVDVPILGVIRSILFIERSNYQAEIRLSTEAIDAPTLLFANANYPKVSEFELTASHHGAQG